MLCKMIWVLVYEVELGSVTLVWWVMSSYKMFYQKDADFELSGDAVLSKD